MGPRQAARREAAVRPSTARLFTVESANRALVLVRRIVQDIVTRYAELMALRTRREELENEVGADRRLADLQDTHQSLIESLNALSEELTDIGVELKDWSGLVDFPALHEGRRVLLCWRLGEPTVAHWHELDGGFKGRQPVTPDFDTASA